MNTPNYLWAIRRRADTLDIDPMHPLDDLAIALRRASPFSMLEALSMDDLCLTLRQKMLLSGELKCDIVDDPTSNCTGITSTIHGYDM